MNIGQISNFENMLDFENMLNFDEVYFVTYYMYISTDILCICILVQTDTSEKIDRLSADTRSFQRIFDIFESH